MANESDISEILKIVKSNRSELIEIRIELRKLQSDASETKKTTDLILGAVETGNQTLLEILAACQGDGSGELVAQLRALTKAIEELTVRVDAVADEVGV